MDICRYLFVCEMSIIPGRVSIVSLQVPLSNFRYDVDSATLLAAKLLSLFLICVLQKKKKSNKRGSSMVCSHSAGSAGVFCIYTGTEDKDFLYQQTAAHYLQRLRQKSVTSV